MGLLDQLGLGIDAGVKQKIVDTIEETLKAFGMAYQERFRVALINKLLDEGGEQSEHKEKEGPEYQLSKPPGSNAPEKEGMLKRQSTILKRWKEWYAVVLEDYQIALCPSAERKDSKDNIVNLWGYTAQAISERPKGKRRGGPQWVEDEKRNTCKACSGEFSVTNRRHHCRACGEIFCNDCSSLKANLTHFGYEDPERVCGDCFGVYGGRSRGATYVPTPDGGFTEVAGDASQIARFYGILLTHSTRIPYLLEFENEKVRDEWMSVIGICIKHSDPPRNKDEVRAQAFEEAHEKASDELGIPGAWHITGTEAEMISDLLQFKLTETIRELLDKLPKNIPKKLRKRVEEAIRKQISIIINAAVQPAWRIAQKGVEAIQAPLEEKLRPILAPLGKAKADIKNKIIDGVNKIADPVMAKVAGPILDKVFEKAAGRVLDAHIGMYKAFAKVSAEFADNVRRAGNDQATLDRELKAAQRAVQGEWWELREVYDLIRSVTEDLRDIKKANDFMKHLDYRAFNNGTINRIHTLLHNAFYTLATESSVQAAVTAGAGVGDAIAAARGTVAAKLLHDSKIELAEGFKALLVDAVLTPAKKELEGLPEVQAILEPLDALVPEMFKDYLSIADTFSEIVDAIVTNAVHTGVDNGTKASRERLTDGLRSIAF